MTYHSRILTIGALALSSAFLLSQPASAQNGRPLAFGKNGMVVAASPTAAQLGQQVLINGGNAVDAIVTTAAAVALMEPNLSSPLGVGYLLYYSPEIGEVKGLEFGGTGPAALKLDDYTSNEIRNRGAKSIAVPGNIAGWVTVLEEHGTISVAEAFEPVIKLAEEGFPLTEALAKSMNSLIDQAKEAGFEETITHWGKEDGSPWAAGDVYKNEGYANTLRAVAEEGLEIIYGGRLGEEIVNTVQKYGGYLSLDDMKNYEPEWMTPISVDYRGYTVYSNSPPSSGLQVLQTLNILEGYDLKEMGHNSPDYLHVMMEAVNLAATDRDAFIGDPEFVDMPIDKLLSDEAAEERRALIDMEKATTSYPPSFQEGTTHFSAADKWGNVIAVTNTLASGWGSRITAGETGMIINNAYAYANHDPEHPGVIGPNRRQAWCLSPMMIFDDQNRFWASVGTPGGETIQQTQTQVIVNLIDFGMDAQTAVEKPRFAHTWMGQPDYDFPEFGVLSTSLDAGLEDEVYSTLEEKGHPIQRAERFGYTGSNAVIRRDHESGWYTGGADPRRLLYAVGH